MYPFRHAIAPLVALLIICALFLSGDMIGNAPACLPAGGDSLAAPSKIDDLIGIQPKDIGDIELWLSACLKEVPPDRFTSTDPRLTSAIRLSIIRKYLLVYGVYGPGATIFNPPGAQFFIHELTMTESGAFRLRVVLEDERYGRRTYYASFTSPNDVSVAPADLSAKRTEADQRTIRRYVDQNERIIDPFIAERIRAGDFLEVRGAPLHLPDRYRPGRRDVEPQHTVSEKLIEELARRVDPVIAPYGLSVAQVFAGRRIVFIMVPHGVPMPVVTEYDEDGTPHKVTVTNHASAAAVYFFVPAGDAGDFESLARYEREGMPRGFARTVNTIIWFQDLVGRTIHEAGAIAGLEATVTIGPDGRARLENDLDRAYRFERALQRIRYVSLRRKKEGQRPPPRELEPVDLNYLAGRDYAGTITPFVTSPFALVDLREAFRLLTDMLNAIDPHRARGGDLPGALERHARTRIRLFELGRLDDDAFVRAIASPGEEWRAIMTAYDRWRSSLDDERIGLCDGLVRRIEAAAAELAAAGASGIDIGLVMKGLPAFEVKPIAVIEDMCSPALAALAGTGRWVPFRFLAKVRRLGSVSIPEVGIADYAAAACLGPGRFLVPVRAEDGTITHRIAVLFPAPDARRQGVRITAFTEREWRALCRALPDDSLLFALARVIRSPEDSVAIAAYREHEEAIDRPISAALSADDRHHEIVERDAGEAIRTIENVVGDACAALAGTQRSDRRSVGRFRENLFPPTTCYVACAVGPSLPHVRARSASGVETMVDVRMHTGPRDTTYLLLTDDEYRIFMQALETGGEAIRRAIESYWPAFVHEGGVRIGLPLAHVDGEVPANELDDLCDEWVRSGQIARRAVYPLLRAILAAPGDLSVDLNNLKGVNAAGEKYFRDLLAGAARTPAGEIAATIRDARAAGPLIPTHLSARYQLLVTHEFFASGELDRDKDRYGDRFLLDAVSGVDHAQFIKNVMQKAEGIEERTVVLVPHTFTVEELAPLAQAGIRCIPADVSVLLNAQAEPEDERIRFQTDTYAMLLLARRADRSMDAGSPIYRALRFYFASHFELAGATPEAYLAALVKGDLATLIKGCLKYRPIEQYALPSYHIVATTLLSA